MTPHGIHAHVPCLELGGTSGCILIDIFCLSVTFMDIVSLYLFLEPDRSPDGHGIECYPRYKCQWLCEPMKVSRGTHGRVVSIVDQTLPNSVRWRNIYISPRPRDHAYAKSDPHELLSRLSLGPSPPFRIERNTIPRLSHDNAVNLTFVTLTSPPWTGNPPVELAFHWRGGMILVTLGVCELDDHDETTPVAHTFHYAVGRFDPIVGAPASRSPSHGKASHSCATDHVSHGSTRTVSLSNGLSSHPSVFRISFTKSLEDPAERTLEVEMRVEVSKDILFTDTDNNEVISQQNHLTQ